MKSTERYWELISSSSSDPECEQFLQLLSCVSRWLGPELPIVEVGDDEGLDQELRCFPREEGSMLRANLQDRVTAVMLAVQCSWIQYDTEVPRSWFRTHHSSVLNSYQ
ncbi:hypothetical protein N1851_014012 [Merluccius polli]|uniref:Uncharacterized protein n=1 Tax=Merluccius polli TaxID=89951 RepID=A0AA47P3U0_MERPO|nr:hypothetical protein N1851_014012 [Merluccius polli]